MDLLREWLAPTMAREIGAMMQFGAGASDKSDWAHRMTYSDDGSNLRARSSKPSVVQITKFYTFDGPIKVVISDSYTYMRATIASSAATNYAATTKRRVTKDTLGGLIQILDFEIVATHLGARSERATILINDFKSIGSEGSGAFGCPRPLESLTEIVDLLDQLKALRERENRGSQPRSRLGSLTEGSPAHSQLSVEGSGLDSPETGQLMFATQVPSRFSGHSLAADGGAQLKISIKSAKSNAKDRTNENAVPDVRPRQGYLSVNTEAKATAHTNMNTSEALLGLIAPKQTKTSPASDQTTMKKRNTAQMPEAKDKTHNMPPELESTLKAEATNNGIGSTTPTSGTEGFRRKDQELKVATNPPLATQSVSELKIAPGVTTQDSLPAHVSQPRRKTDLSHSKTAENCQIIAQSPKSFKRLCSSDIRIPQDQQVLLDRVDSWLPAEPGSRGPIANVPITTLQAMNRCAELTIHPLSSSLDRHRHEESVGATNPLASQSSSGLNDVDKGDIDSEIPLSSAEWPPSPPFEPPGDGLPPDSSIESKERRENKNGRDRNQSDHFPQSQKLLTVSPCSTPTRSKRENPKRTSKALQSTARSSPSIASGSADEEAKRFKCQQPGCDRAYVGASGLRYHMEHFHATVVSKGSPSRSRAPKSKRRGKSSVISYICARCYNHFDTEEEITHHENLDSCFTPQPGLLQQCVYSGASIGQLPTNTEQPFANPVRNDEIVDLRQRQQRDGPISVVWRLGESSSMSPARTYVSPYASPRQAERLIGNSRSSSKSISVRQIELIPERSRPTPSPHDTIVPKLDGQWSKGERSDASSADSDLETTIPHALNEAKDLHANGAPMQRFPSTAIQPEESFIQIKRTPYVNGRLNDKVPSLSDALPLNGRMSNSSFTGPTKWAEHEVLPHPSTTPEMSGAKISVDQNGQIDPTNIHPAHEVENQTNSVEANMASRIHREVGAQSQNSRSASPMIKQNASILNSLLLRSASASTSSELSPYKDEVSVTGARSGSDLKRRSFEPTPLSPNVVKRRKHLKASDAFKFSQDVQVAQDPSILARAYRQEFLASRKSSLSEQSDFSRGTIRSPEKSSDPTIQHNHRTGVVRDGDTVSKLEVNETPADIETSSSALSPLEKTQPLTSEANNQPAIFGNEEDVVTTIEGQDNATNDKILPPGAQDDKDSGIVAGVCENKTNEGHNTGDPTKAQNCQCHNLDTGSVSTKANVDQISKSDEIARSPPSVDNQHAGAELDSRSVGNDFGDTVEINENTALFGAQDGRGFLNQINASLPSQERLNLISNEEPSLESLTEASAIPARDKIPGQADVLMVNADPRHAAEVDGAAVHRDQFIPRSSPTVPATVFGRFKAAYPNYLGNEERFVAICKKINTLVQQDRMEHRSLWDDFIVRHTMEYLQYLQICALSAEDPLPYERFYRNEIDEPKYTKRIVTDKNLMEILSVRGQEGSAAPLQQRHHSLKHSVHVYHKDVSSMPSFRSPIQPASAAASTPKIPLPQATVDLTNDSDDSGGSQPVLSARISPRSLPWVKLGRDAAPSTPLKKTRLAPSGSEETVAQSSPLPRTSARLNVKPSPRTARDIPDKTRANRTSSEKASVSRPSDIAEDQTSNTTNEGRKDKVNHFKKFAKAYTSIRPGNGNHFAGGTAGKDRQADRGAQRRKDLNVLDWHL